MADRFQDRRSSPEKIEGDPLAELARLIGQTDPMSAFGRSAKAQQPAHAGDYPDDPQFDLDAPAPPSRPSWMQHAARQQGAAEAEPVIQPVHPLHRYATPTARSPEPDYHEAPAVADQARPYEAPVQPPQPDPNRYDDALYGPPDEVAGYHTEQPARYPDDPYTYGDADADQQAPQKKRSGGLMTVGVVLALAVVGTGGAFAYRTFVGSPRGGEPPIIKADNSPTKVVTAPSGDAAKVADRMAAGAATEKLVPREEKPVDVKDVANSGPRVVFPPLNQNTNPPSTASVSPGARPLMNTASGILSGDEPRRIKTLAVKGDPSDAAASPAARPVAQPKPTVAAARPTSPVNANASINAPLSLSAPVDATRTASTSPAPGASPGGPAYLVQIASQRTEAEAAASYRALQGKFPAVLGSRSPLIRRADLGDKGIFYRAMIGPFGSPDEASQFCGNLKSAGGQCVVQRN